ncbi:MAG: outer membrane protein [Bacteroidota bacterium]
MKYINHTILIFAVLVFTLPGYSQEKDWSVQLSAGPTIHYGDIMDHDLFFPAVDNDKAWNFSGAFSLERRLNPYLSLRGQLLYGELGGTRSSVTNPRYFDADLFDVSLQGRLDFINLFADYNPYRTFNIYGLLGVGMSNWESHLYDVNDSEIGSSGGVDVGMLEMTSEGFIPAGGGISFRVNDNFDLNLESTMRIVNSDDLDAAPPNGSKYDMYSFTSLGLTYKFGGKQTESRKRSEEEVSHRLDDQESDTAKEEKEAIEEEPAFEAEIASEMPEEVNAGQSFAVNININKGDLTGPATLRQVFPADFEVQPLAMANGDFNFANQVLTVNWEELPANKELKLSYRVKTDDIDGGTYPISGIFTYTQKAQSELVSFKNSVKVNAPEKSKTAKDTAYDQQDERIDEGTVFRVQIRAKYQRKMSVEAMKNQYNLDEKIYEDRHGGYYIYTVGNFSTYEEAKQKRQTLNRRHGISDAFVVAFVDGKRVNKLSDLDRF